ncbi:MAG TPA: GAF domain-containing protein, partial [Verrucomicrobiae bacterium]
MSNTDILGFAAALVCCGLALIVACNRQRSVAHWAFIIGMAVLAAENVLFALTADASLPADIVFWQKWRLIASSFASPVWLFFSLTYARWNQSDFFRSWPAVLVAVVVVPVGIAGLSGDDLIVSADQISAAQWMFHLGLSGAVLNLISLLAAVVALMNLESTFRAAVGTMLWRIKFMILGMGVIFIVTGYVDGQALLFGNTLALSLQSVAAMGTLFGAALSVRSLLRKGHFETNVYPSKFILRTSLVLVLAGIYFFVVGILAKVVEFFGGDSAFTLKAFILLVTLVLATVLALSDRVRQQTRLFMSRHFQRPVYDYRSMWRRFAGETASAVQPAELCQATVKFLADVLQALSVSIWLVDDKRENFTVAASTFLSDAKANALNLTTAHAVAVMQALEKRPEPVDIDASREDWAAALKQCHPDQFRSGGNRICAPLMSGGQMVGMIILGDRVKGVPFSWQDLDLLKCVADSAAAGLMNIQLSQRLLQAGQMEAFQTMS